MRGRPTPGLSEAKGKKCMHYELNFLKTLFESDVYAALRQEYCGKEDQGIVNDVLETGKALSDLLSEPAQLVFLMYGDVQKAYAKAAEFNGFIRGFHLGAGCMLDAMGKGKP